VNTPQPDPERILAEVDRRRAEAAEQKAREDAEYARRKRLYEVFHCVEVYDDDHYASEYGQPPLSDQRFCQGWAGNIVTLANVLAADGWWEQVVTILSNDDQGRYVLAVLSSAKADDRDGTAKLLEEACRRGEGMSVAAKWLRLWLSRELLRSGVEATPSTRGDEPESESASTPQDEGRERLAEPQEGMTWQKAAERMKRLRDRGDQWTSQHKLAKQFGCSSGTINKAIKNTPELQNWAQQEPASPKAQSLTPFKKGEGYIEPVTDRTLDPRASGPADDAAIQEHLEREDLTPAERAFFNGLSREDQLAFLDDPDKYQKIRGRKP
jgi:hypothetical protein